jgi:hypothetical protein
VFTKQILAVLAVALCLAAMVAGANAAEGDGVAPLFTVEQIQRDLALEVTRKSADTIGPGEAVALEINLVNNSKERGYFVVEPGDGSEMGWREPHVYFTAMVKHKDEWVDVPAGNLARCGLFDAAWQNDVVKLDPGKKVKIEKWIIGPERALDLQKPGLVRLLVHYKYGGGKVGKGERSGVSGDLGEMTGIPAFEIVSKPVEFTVKRPFDVTVKVKGSLKAGEEAKLSDVLDVLLVGGATEGSEVKAPTLSADARLYFETEEGAAPRLTEQREQYGKEFILGPADKISILGKSTNANGIDGVWTVQKAGAVKVRALYVPTTWKSGPTIKSDWVEVEVK